MGLIPREGCTYFSEDNTIILHTAYGDMTAEVVDWIIKEANGSFYPCKLHPFEESYVLVHKSKE